MRTLKKTLCLVLALALCFSLASVAFAGNFDDYTDADKVTYTEAVDYLMAAGVVKGDTETTINPQGDLTRAQAAKLVAYAMLGESTADAMKADSDPFTDVAKGSWAAGYIAYCSSVGIINGNGDGTFRPNDKVTGYEFAKMMLVALGYGVNSEYTGKGWAIAVAKDALPLGIFAEVTDAASNEAIDRETAFQIVFNTMTKPSTVSYNDAFKLYYSVSPTDGVINNVPANTLGYKQYGLVEVATTDDLSNGAHYWAKSGATGIALTGKYVDDVVLGTVTAAVTGGELYTGYKFDETVAIYVNGDSKGNLDQTNITRANKGTVLSAYAGANSINLVDTDYDSVVDSVVVELPYLAKVTKVTAATAADDANITLTVYTGAAATTTNVKVYTDDTYAKDDYVLVVPKNDTFTASSTNKVISIEAISPVSGTISAYSTTPANTITVDGTAYAAASKYVTATGFTAFASVTSFTTNYKFFLVNGYALAVITDSSVTALDYVYVTKSQASAAGTDLLGTTTTDALRLSVIYLDGTTAVVDYNLKTATATIGTIAKGETYYTDADDSNVKLSTASSENPIAPGLYSYTMVDGKIQLSDTLATDVAPITTGVLVDDATVSVTKGEAAVTGVGGAYATSSTKLVLVKGTTVTSYTGYANFPTSADYDGTATPVVVITKGTAITNILVVGAEATSDPNYVYGVYVGKGATSASGTAYNFYVDGEIKSYVTKSAVSLTAKDVVTIDVAEDGTTLNSYTKVEDAEVIFTKTVSSVDSDYIVFTDDSLVYKNANCKTYNISEAVAATWTADDVAVNDTVTYLVKTNVSTGVDEIIYIFIISVRG
jgi:hypothetical protein